jgi:uncharacterized coiled-coil DUF342 family protein
MFPSNSEINDIKNIARRVSSKTNINDNVYYVLFKTIDELNKKIEKLQKDLKDLNGEVKDLKSSPNKK